MSDLGPILCGTTISWRSVGGLNAIVLNLASHSSSAHVWVAREHYRPTYDYDDLEGLPTVLLDPRRGGTRAMAVARRLGRRAPTLAIGAFGWAVRPALASASSSASGVLWVGNGAEFLGFELLRFARRRHLPFLVWPAIHPGTWGDAPLDARLYCDADRVLAQSRYEHRTLERLGVPSDRIVLVRPGPTVDPGGDAERFRRGHGIGDEFLVGFVGRRTVGKGLDLLIGAFGLLPTEIRSRTRLVVAGPSGDARAELPPGSVDVGVCDERAKADLFAALDVLCLPSAAESFGLVYLDAWSYGKPVIAGVAPASRELVRHGVDGLHVERDHAAVAAAIRELASDPGRAAAMGAAGLERQRREYTWPSAAAAYDEAMGAAAVEPTPRVPRTQSRRQEARYS